MLGTVHVNFYYNNLVTLCLPLIVAIHLKWISLLFLIAFTHTLKPLVWSGLVVTNLSVAIRCYYIV